MTGRTEWKVDSSLKIRSPILDSLVSFDMIPKVNKHFVSLALGDPTKNPDLQPHPVAIDAVTAALASGEHNGYGPHEGLAAARAAIAEYHTEQAARLNADVAYKTSDVVLANGASEALDLAISALCAPGSNILLPRPGFVYTCITDARRVRDRYYDLDPERDWEVDLAQMESLVDEKTAAILVTNPSNPCGSNYSLKHLQEIVDVAKRHYLPIIADEIYGDIVFADEQFFPLAAASSDVPIVTISGLAKRWLVPGWRIGWSLVHDPRNLLPFDLRGLMKDLAQVSLAPSSFTQAAVPAILRDTPPAFHAHVLRVLEENARLLMDKLSGIRGLRPLKPSGALYMMVAIDFSVLADIADEWDFVQKLVYEEAVFAVPGRCFQFEGYMRIVTATRKDHLEEACVRLAAFCERHSR